MRVRELIKKTVSRARRVAAAASAPVAAASVAPGTQIGSSETQDYWSDFNVTLHHQFRTAEESLAYFDWRNDQYFGYIERMPVAGFDGKRVLDFGCGPGHDVVGFAVHSKPSRLVGADISPRSVAEARHRLKLHSDTAEIIQMDPSAPKLPFEDASFDHIHSSGVLHHAPDLGLLLRELYRVLAPGGTLNIMVYNYDSLWMHLHVAYSKQVIEKAYPGLSLREAYTRTTDTEDCPIADCYTPDEFLAHTSKAGFKGVFAGAGISMHELLIAPTRFAAIQNRELPAESRRFLLALKVDEHGYPTYNGHLAGIDACYHLTKPE